MATWAERYLNHFMRFFGKPFDIEIYRQEDGSELRLATFDHTPFKNYRAYASLGLSDQAEILKDRGEVILLADDAGKDVPFLFVNSLFFMLSKRIALGSRFAIGGIDMVRPDFAEYFDKHAIYYSVADGFPNQFEEVPWIGQTGLVFQGRFISWAEYDLVNRQGGAALEGKLKQQDTDPCSIRRPSCV